MSMTPRGYERFSTLSGPQQQIFEKLSSLLQGRLGGQDNSAFEAPEMRRFQEQTVPGLAERFAGLGAGSQSSSAFRQALGGAGADLSERLAKIGGEREDAATNQLMQLLGLSTEGLVQKEQPFWKQLLLGLSGGVGQALPGLFSGGGALSSILGNLGKGGMDQGTFSSIQPGSYGQQFTPR